MIYNYDEEVDILTIRFRDTVKPGDIVDSEEFGGGLVAEYGSDGNIVQVELRDVSKLIADRAVARRKAA
jgi:uncharacterized protein YuzE